MRLNTKKRSFFCISEQSVFMNHYELGANCNTLIFSDEFFDVFLVRQQNPLYICIAKNDRLFVVRRSFFETVQACRRL